MTRHETIEWLVRLLDVTVTRAPNYCDEYREALRAAIALLRVPQGERAQALERQWQEENLRCRGLEARLKQVTGLLEPRSMGRPPEYRLCSTCRAMLLAALGQKEDRDGR